MFLIRTQKVDLFQLVYYNSQVGEVSCWKFDYGGRYEKINNTFDDISGSNILR